MKDEEIDELLKLAFFSRHSTEVDNELADSLKEATDGGPTDTGSRLRQRFIEELFRRKHSQAIKTVDSKMPFGTWICRTRESLKIDCRELAKSLELQPEILERLEKGGIKPWDLNLDLCLRIMRVMRLHYEGLSALVQTTAAVSQMTGINAAQARCHSGKMTSSRGDAAAKALDLFKAHNADPVRDEQAEDWLRALRLLLLNNESETDLVD